jgi:hypothetical protein
MEIFRGQIRPEPSTSEDYEEEEEEKVSIFRCMVSPEQFKKYLIIP